MLKICFGMDMKVKAAELSFTKTKPDKRNISGRAVAYKNKFKYVEQLSIR